MEKSAVGFLKIFMTDLLNDSFDDFDISQVVENIETL